MKKTRWLIGCAVLSVPLLGMGGASAADAPPGPGRHAPPQEAIEACNGLQEGTACTVTFGDGRQLSGTCRTGPQGSAAACAPNGPPPGGFRPPPEAVQACSSLQEGASCSFTMPDGDQLAGTCRASPDGSTVACAPAHPPAQR